jgi:hypothetical protein
MDSSENSCEISKYAIIGAGGIGSHFCRILSRLLGSTLDNLNAGSFTVYDFDVVEPKNVRWQDYDMQDVGTPKAMQMTLRYQLPSKVKRFEDIDLGGHRVYLIAADNARVRKLVFDHVKLGLGNKSFIDMRAEGDVYAVFTELCTHEELLASLGANTDSIVGLSCQRQEDQERNIVQLGNWFAATLGMDIFLRLFRNKPYPASVVRTIL